MTKPSKSIPSNPMKVTVGMGYGGNMPVKIVKHLKKNAGVTQKKTSQSATDKS